jgi:endonuclease III
VTAVIEKLIQEDYCDTPDGGWKVLVISQLLTLPASTEVLSQVVEDLFEEYPSPWDLETKDLTWLERERLCNILQPLGLSTRRMKLLLTMSRQYRASARMFGPEYHKYQIGGFTGCGQCSVDAWQLFILREPCTPTDKRLRRYAKERGLYADDL